MQALTRTFSEHKQGLEGQWHRGEEVATEDLRLALQRYRSFFDRMLSRAWGPPSTQTQRHR
ncbi:hypothetical protein FHX80_111041 [Streptomyces brevispora]|uniref:Uncharacterized protein n=1 Tax=Streptomyces brevispora TaxID=887462 RepID=A0A561UTE7_9ACTN|nr:hypothetical protein [Streptomyces brevispora]TWG02631.1 hypothetical protein FHX80_111041 [Streptomyces brevispora]